MLLVGLTIETYGELIMNDVSSADDKDSMLT